VFNGVTIADTKQAWRVLETSHPPVYYLPPEDIAMEYLSPGNGRTRCEWKGEAQYCTVTVGDKQAADAAWYYHNPLPAFAAIKDYVAFYPRLMDGCYVAGEPARPQPGQLYGGWITSDIVGPFKGDPGTMGW
jgi:uncharacterized protein (DUF427 family)